MNQDLFYTSGIENIKKRENIIKLNGEEDCGADIENGKYGSVTFYL